jgi:hypothetical protein
MELSNDQKAILRLLAQRGAAGYEDLTALLGIDAAEVHERAKAAAAQLEADGIPAPSIPVPEASEPAAVPEPAKPAPIAPPEPKPVTPPEPPAPAPTPAAPAPAPAAAAEPPRADPPKSTGPGPGIPLPKSGGARAALAAAVAIVAALIVVVILVSGGGDSGDATTATDASTTASEETGSIAAANPKLTQAVLSPLDGGDAKGLATFGRVKKSLALQLEAEGLEPTAKGQSYTVWLYASARKRLPLASTTVGANGKIGAQVEVPTEVLAYLATETFDQLYISLTDDSTLEASLAKATKEKKSPTYTGTDVLSGTVAGPIVGAAKNVKNAKK